MQTHITRNYSLSTQVLFTLQQNVLDFCLLQDETPEACNYREKMTGGQVNPGWTRNIT